MQQDWRCVDVHTAILWTYDAAVSFIYIHTTQGVFKIGLSAVSVNIELNKSNKRYVGQVSTLRGSYIVPARHSPGFLRSFIGTNKVDRARTIFFFRKKNIHIYDVLLETLHSHSQINSCIFEPLEKSEITKDRKVASQAVTKRWDF